VLLHGDEGPPTLPLCVQAQQWGDSESETPRRLTGWWVQGPKGCAAVYTNKPEPW
jgi:hypothetical protein